MGKFDLVEKRKSMRAFAKIPVICEIVDPKDKSITKKTMLTQNISSEGMFLEADVPVPLGAQIDIRFRLPSLKKDIEAVTKVVRVEIVGEGKVFGLGVFFTSLSEQDRLEIKQSIEQVDIHGLLRLAIQKGASDIHLTANFHPVLRINGELHILSDRPKFGEQDIPAMVFSLMSKQQIKQFETGKELTFGYQLDADNRFRINLYQQRGFVDAAIRYINTQIHSLKDLNIPEVVKEFTRLNEGLVLVVGPTGSGKTTTASAMVELMNQEREVLIVTLERPIEYVHINKKSIIKQREVGVDTQSFSSALENSLKQDLDVLMIGELDNMDTVRTAMVAAEAGHLVIATFHAPNTAQAIDRLGNMFSPEHRKQILFQLSQCLKGIVAQLLIPSKNVKEGRVLATEVVVVNDAVRRVIRQDDLIQLPNIVQTGSAYKMQSMFDSIRRWVELKIVDQETADRYSEEFARMH